MRWPCLLACGLLAACAGLEVVRDEWPLPQALALLPLQGEADPRLRTLCRALLRSGLQQYGLRVVETEHTDRILAEYGWLADPEQFAPDRIAVADACAALGVDALLVGTGFDEHRFNLLLLRRHAFAGSLLLRRPDGSAALQASGSATRTGGLLLQSGQVLDELRAQGEHGTPRASAALVDSFVDDLLAALPAPGPAAAATAAMAVALLAVDPGIEQHGDESRLTVRGAVPPGTRVWLDLEPDLAGVPASERQGTFSVARDVDPARIPPRFRLRARDGFGNSASVDVVR
ncbi:MAG TPA: hypothetical protein VF384_18430 [Planctomycetota bacterium]